MYCLVHLFQDGAEYGSCVASSGKTLQFFVCFVFLLFYVLDVVSITVYDRDTLLNIGSSVAQRKPDFEFFNAGGLFTDTASEPFVWVAKTRRRRRRRKRGKRAGVLVRLRRRAFRPPLPTILLANVQSLDNKLCELRARISYQRETRDCCVICLTETWILRWFQTQPSSSRASPCTARIEQRSSQGKAEAGVFVSISTTHGVMKGTYTLLNPSAPWSGISYASVSTILATEGFYSDHNHGCLYTPPQANTDQALKEQYRNISEQETAHPDAAFVITGDFK